MHWKTAFLAAAYVGCGCAHDSARNCTKSSSLADALTPLDFMIVCEVECIPGGCFFPLCLSLFFPPPVKRCNLVCSEASQAPTS